MLTWVSNSHIHLSKNPAKLSEWSNMHSSPSDTSSWPSLSNSCMCFMIQNISSIFDMIQLLMRLQFQMLCTLYSFFVKHLWNFIQNDTLYENELMLYLKNMIKSVYVLLVWRVFGGQFVHIVALAPCCDDGHNCPAACNFDNLSDGTLFRGARVFYASNDSALCVQQWPSRSLA